MHNFLFHNRNPLLALSQCVHNINEWMGQKFIQPNVERVVLVLVPKNAKQHVSAAKIQKWRETMNRTSGFLFKQAIKTAVFDSFLLVYKALSCFVHKYISEKLVIMKL